MSIVYSILIKDLLQASFNDSAIANMRNATLTPIQVVYEEHYLSVAVFNFRWKLDWD